VDSAVLDLFAGSGSLGIEAISRGAEVVYFVDTSFNSVNLISENIKKLKNLEAEYKIIRQDVIKFLRDYRGSCFDLVFVDPPYKIEKEKMSDIFALLGRSDRKIISKDSVIVYEYFSKRDIKEETNELNVVKNAHFGDKIVSYIKPL
jgi:16S rRNA (guanine966-N2)-methyltransferase